MIRDFYKSYQSDDKPWLIVGMGPTFSHWRDFNLDDYNVLGINRVASKIPVKICQIIDFYIADKIEQSIYENCKFLVMPYFPHFMCRPILELNIYYLEKHKPVVRQMSMENRLLCFNLSTMPFMISNTPLVKACYFSAEAAVSLLANWGVKKIRLLGVDGGNGVRADEFKDHGPTDPRGFDLQWTTINENIKKFNLDIQHLVRNPDGLYQNQENSDGTQESREQDGSSPG